MEREAIPQATPNSKMTALLGNEGRYTLFASGDECLKFIAPYSLERYVKVTEWEAGTGYLVVLAKYAHSDEPVEEYIDLMPILEDLYIDPYTFLGPIEAVEVRNG